MYCKCSTSMRTLKSDWRMLSWCIVYTPGRHGRNPPVLKDNGAKRASNSCREVVVYMMRVLLYTTQANVQYSYSEGSRSANLGTFGTTLGHMACTTSLDSAGSVKPQQQVQQSLNATSPHVKLVTLLSAAHVRRASCRHCGFEGRCPVSPINRGSIALLAYS